MSYNVLLSKRFEKELKRLVKKYPSLKEEFIVLVNILTEKPQHGVFVGNNCYKIRLAIASKGKGKSGGARVIIYLYVKTETVYMLAIYDKSETQDLKDNDVRAMVVELELDIKSEDD